jgi:hypothetical protein
MSSVSAVVTFGDASKDFGVGTGFRRRVCSPEEALCASASLLISLLDPLIQRFKHSRIRRGYHVHRRVEFFFGHPRFPCVRKAPIHSRIAEPHHRDGETDKHLLALGEALHRVRIAIESPEVSFLQGRCSLQAEGTARRAPTNP